jgi:hypothetical protein
LGKQRDWVNNCAEVALSDSAAQAAWDRAASDLASLQTGEGNDVEPAMVIAGMPNDSGLFGRDTYLTAIQSATLNPTTSRRTGGFDAVQRDRDRRLSRRRAR